MSTDTKDLVQRLRLLQAEQLHGEASLYAECADTIERLTTELANERARGIHFCHADCTRDGCVNRRLRDELAALRASLAKEPAPVHQWRKTGTAPWWDGRPDNEDGGGPYETRTLYAGSPPADHIADASKLVSPLRQVHLTRDTSGACVVTLNGFEVIRDCGDIIDHVASPDWLAGFSVGAPPKGQGEKP